MFNQGKDSLRRHHSCAGLIQDNLSLLKLQLSWKYLGSGNEISVCFRKGVRFETGVIWNSPFADLNWDFFFL